MADQVKAKFAGKWKLDRNENFEAFMAAMGANFFVRKLEPFLRPDSEIRVADDGTISITTSTPFIKTSHTFKLNEEYDERSQFTTKNFKNLATYANGKLRITPRPAEPVNQKYVEFSERELAPNGDMIMTMKVKDQDVQCKRFYKRVES